jgi:hypothetical protein
MGEIHEGVCGAHHSTYKMKWMKEEQVIFGRPCWRIVSSIIKGVKSLAIFRNL